jgi:hypothetical protein
MYYGNEQIVWGARLSDIMVLTPDGGFAIDFDKFDDVEPAALPPWNASAAEMAEP